MAAHPLHPAIVHLPLGLLASATIADVAHLAGLWREPRFAAWLMAWGLGWALVAMAAGLYDFRRLDSEIVPHALRHAGAMAIAIVGYSVTLYLRRASLGGVVEPPTLSFALSIVSGLVLALGGWLGGELVYRYGAGRIDP